MVTVSCESKLKTLSVERFLCNFWMGDVILETDFFFKFKNMLTSKTFGQLGREKKITKIPKVGSIIENGTIHICYNSKVSTSYIFKLQFFNTMQNIRIKKD